MRPRQAGPGSTPPLLILGQFGLGEVPPDPIPLLWPKVGADSSSHWTLAVALGAIAPKSIKINFCQNQKVARRSNGIIQLFVATKPS
jgi:hypothetical protein